MNEQDQINYSRIAKAIEFIKTNFRNQPSLDEISKEVSLSPHHFQRMFQEWAGTTPKKFLQYISIEHAKSILLNKTVAESTFESGLSATSRLHDLFVFIEGMTPAEYKHGGVHLTINYSFSGTLFGEAIIASTSKGICSLAFCENREVGLEALKSKFPHAQFVNETDDFQRNALNIFQQDWSNLHNIKLHLKGTDFQLKVWEALLKIPLGGLSTYGSIAEMIGNPNASRAVGTAIGSNPVAFLIPCHRVIQSSGIFGGYMWGPIRKTAIIGWESAVRSCS